MQNRRSEQRMLCADLVDVQWKDKSRKTRHKVAILEDISLSGACLQSDTPIPMQTEIRIRHSKGELRGRVCYCIHRESGHFLGIQFDSGARWSPGQFHPQHLLDPRTMTEVIAKRAQQRRGETIH